ncbi:unnamed protein product [Cochlearia groenlandica]
MTTLCPEKTTLFKKTSRSKTFSSSMMKARNDTFFRKAHELSTLCDVDVCVIYYGRDGELIKTWPEDQSKVRDMADRFAKLSKGEKAKKSTTLSQFLNKRINDDKKHDFNRFSEKLSAVEASLLRRLPFLQEKLQLLCPDDQIPALIDMSSSSSSPPPPIVNVQTSNNKTCHVSTTDVSSSQTIVVDNQTEPLKNHMIQEQEDQKIYTGNPMHNNQERYTILLLDGENGTFTQIGTSVSGFEQLVRSIQGFGSLARR